MSGRIARVHNWNLIEIHLIIYEIITKQTKDVERKTDKFYYHGICWHRNAASAIFIHYHPKTQPPCLIKITFQKNWQIELGSILYWYNNINVQIVVSVKYMSMKLNNPRFVFPYPTKYVFYCHQDIDIHSVYVNFEYSSKSSAKQKVIGQAAIW